MYIHTNVTKGNPYTMEWFLNKTKCSKPIPTRGLHCGDRRVFFFVVVVFFVVLFVFLFVKKAGVGW